MTTLAPRVAFFADSFHEVNGVALTARHGLAMLSVHDGERAGILERGSVRRVEFPVSAFSFGLERDLRFDLAFIRRLSMLREEMRGFAPDLVHITGPSHVGMLGAILAHEFKLPLVASWHTNVHEYAGRRLPNGVPQSIRQRAEEASLWAASKFYRLARLILAPNTQLCDLLERRTGRPCHLMRRGVDCQLFDPARRSRSDRAIVVGYVGRLSPEKNVQVLKCVEQALARTRFGEFRIEIAGHGSERSWLAANLSTLRDHGVLRGAALADAYANFDIFAFPSETDTFGNVVQEAMASGVPCVVMDRGGPASIVSHGNDGLIARNAQSFVQSIIQLANDENLRASLGSQARRTALGARWDRVFESVYDSYSTVAAYPPAAARIRGDEAA